MSHEQAMEKAEEEYRKWQVNTLSPVDIVLGHSKDDLMVEYATYGMETQLFVAKCELYLHKSNIFRTFALDFQSVGRFRLLSPTINKENA